MKVISLLQPWASLVVAGHKKIETRSWNTKYRGELLIHASKKFDKSQKALCFTKFFEHHLADVVDDLPLGAIIGRVKLIDTISTYQIGDKFGQGLSIYRPPLEFNLTERERAYGDYSPNRYGWLFYEPVTFQTAIPAKGSLSLWEWQVPDHVDIVDGQVYPVIPFL